MNKNNTWRPEGRNFRFTHLFLHLTWKNLVQYRLNQHGLYNNLYFTELPWGNYLNLAGGNAIFWKEPNTTENNMCEFSNELVTSGRKFSKKEQFLKNQWKSHPKRPVTCILGTGLVTCLVSNWDLELELVTVAMAISSWCLSNNLITIMMDHI